MRKVIVTMWVTLDGFVAGPNGELDWVTNSFDQAMGKYEDDIVSAADTLILGRVTYQSFAGSWPHVPENPNAAKEEVEYANKLNAMRKIVFSRTLDTVEWNNSALFKEVIPEEIEKLKQEPGKDILIYGSASIVQTLTNLGLIDEYQILIHPLILGSGKRLFENIQERINLKLVKADTTDAGIARLYYQPEKM